MGLHYTTFTQVVPHISSRLFKTFEQTRLPNFIRKVGTKLLASLFHNKHAQKPAAQTSPKCALSTRPSRSVTIPLSKRTQLTTLWPQNIINAPKVLQKMKIRNSKTKQLPLPKMMFPKLRPLPRERIMEQKTFTPSVQSCLYWNLHLKPSHFHLTTFYSSLFNLFWNPSARTLNLYSSSIRGPSV